MEKLLSIIVPVYNADRHISKCIESILKSEYNNFELIAIDDGSTDDSGRILDCYKKKDLRIRVFHIPNGGVSRARNKGIVEARGDYITFVDADDYVKPQMFSEMIHAIEQYSCEIAVCTRTKVIEGVEEQLNLEGIQVEEVVNLKIDEFHSIYDWSVTWGKVYQRKLWENVEFPDNCEYGEDLFAAADVWSKSSRFVYINRGYYCYRINPNSVSYTLGEKKNWDRIIASRHAWEWIHSSCLKSRKAMFDLLFGAYVVAYKETDNSKKKEVIHQFRNLIFKTPLESMRIKTLLFMVSPQLFLKLKGSMAEKNDKK